MYSMVLDELSPDVVHQYVGHEPSGLSFNKISLDYKGILYLLTKYHLTIKVYYIF